MELHTIISVTATNEPDVYLAFVDLTDMAGERYETEYVSRPDDTFGLAPSVRAGIDQWITDGKPVLPYEARTVEEIRQNMPELSPRQIRMGLRQISITDQVIENYLQDDPDGLIEWKYANSYRRLHPLVVDLGELLEIPDTQIDDLWMWASEL